MDIYFTITLVVNVFFAPFFICIDTLIFAVPFFLPVTFPPDDTVATFGLLDLNVTFTSAGLPVYFATCVNPAGNVIFRALLLPLFTENEDGAFTLSTDSQGAIKALSAVVHNVAKT